MTSISVKPSSPCVLLTSVSSSINLCLSGRITAPALDEELRGGALGRLARDYALTDDI